MFEDYRIFAIRPGLALRSPLTCLVPICICIRLVLYPPNQASNPADLVDLVKSQTCLWGLQAKYQIYAIRTDFALRSLVLSLYHQLSGLSPTPSYWVNFKPSLMPHPAPRLHSPQAVLAHLFPTDALLDKVHVLKSLSPGLCRTPIQVKINRYMLY